MSIGEIATVVALIPTFVVLFLTARQLWAGRRASSAAALISLNESLRQAWLHFKNATEEMDVQYAFSDVVNLLEIACATRRDGLFVGRSGKIIERYLVDILAAISESDNAKTRIEKMLSDHPGTFENILMFIQGHRRQIIIKTPNVPR